MTFIRFTSNSLTVFETPEEKDFEIACIEYFRPSPKDNGKSSFFLYDKKIIDFITAGYITRKPNTPKTQKLLFIDDYLFKISNVKIEYQSSNIFSCIEKNHYCADFTNPEVLNNFINNLKNYLLKKPNVEVGISYSRSEIKNLLKKTDSLCKNYETELLGKWVSDFLNT